MSRIIEIFFSGRRVKKVKTLHKSYVLQLDQSDCGVACLLSLINYYGGTTTLEKLREVSGTNTQGIKLCKDSNGFLTTYLGINT